MILCAILTAANPAWAGHHHKARKGKPKMTTEEVIAKTLHAEARGEGIEGMRHVMSVIYNRAGGDWNKAKSVCLSPKQFSCWNGTAGAQLRAMKLSDCCSGAITLPKAWKGKSFAPTTTARWYHATWLTPPAWARDLAQLEILGNHIFYGLKHNARRNA